ncbi:MAG TPA: 50S ribosomal protein L3 [Actinomycetota bacterium]|jgi:large subunit ribosomal protein L3
MTELKGILGEKLGMTQIFDDTRAIPVTVMKAGPCVVTQIRTTERDGYEAVQLAFAEPRRVTRPMKGHFDKAGTEGGRHLVELRTDDASTYAPGQEIRADIFSVGERADVVGVSRGHGYAGVIKRHGFGGLSASHGTERKHRAPGAIGACATPSRVFKGMPMAGQHGNQRVTILNLEVVQADAERGLLLLKGAVPGPVGGLVMIRSAVKTPAAKGA